MTSQAKKTNPAVSVAKALLKSLFMTIIIVVVSVVVIRINQKLGILLMFTGSCLMVLLTARKSFLLNTLTCVLPGAMVLSCFILQVILPVGASNTLSATGLIAGALVGGIMGLVHKISEEKGRLIAKRSWGYVLTWVLTFLITQTSSLWGIEKIARLGFVLSGFSTAMLAAMSLILLIRYRHRIRRLTPVMASSAKIAGLWLLIFLPAFTTLAFAQTARVNSAQEAVYKLLTLQDLPGYMRSPDTMTFDTDGWIRKRKERALRPPVKDFGCNMFWLRRENLETFEVHLFNFGSKSDANRFYQDRTQNPNAERKSISGCGDAARLFTYNKKLATLEMLHGQWLVVVNAAPLNMNRPDNSLNARVRLCMDVIKKIDGRLGGIQYGSQQISPQRQQTPQQQQQVSRQRQQTYQQQQQASQRQQPTSQQRDMPESSGDWERYISKELGRKAEDTGKAAAAIQLTFAVLMSALMAASEAAAQGVAGLQGIAGLYPVRDTTTPPPPPVVSTRILDGQEAITWLQDRNMLDKDGNLTEKFDTWFDRSHTDTGTGPSELEGFAGNINRRRPDGKEGPVAGGKLDGNIAIIVREPVTSHEPPSEPSFEPASITPLSPETKTETASSPELEPSPQADSVLAPSPPEIPVVSEEPAPGPTPTPPPLAGPLPKPDTGLELTPAWLKRNPLLSQNPNSMFTTDYMKNQIDAKFQGADSDALNNAMSELAKNPQGQALDSALKNIAEIRGRPIDQITSEYRKYQELRKQREENNPGGTAELYSCLHSGFMGSTSQLRSGRIVGTAFGIDPVFGAMLNPTGGLVGPGNLSIDADNSAVGYHGAMHDAAGYLYKSHKVGPGYDYLRKDQPRDTASPLSGQSEGIRMWRETLGEEADTKSRMAELEIRFIVSAMDTAEEAVQWGIDITDLEPAGNFLVEKFDKFNIF
ncbi:MAG: hypothetical protein JW837_18780 [Sedimentisphaerales bacterium]|nr:hypothetical protein [Sedimentisphaerales bacterium]